MIDHDTAERLAHMTHALRPDWPTKSLLTFIRSEMTNHTYREAAISLAWIATDPDTRTPKRVLEQGPWVNATRAEAPTVSVIPTRCGEHPTRLARDCPYCAQTETADEPTREAHLETMRTAIRALSTERRQLRQGTLL